MQQYMHYEKPTLRPKAIILRAWPSVSPASRYQAVIIQHGHIDSRWNMPRLTSPHIVINLSFIVWKSSWTDLNPPLWRLSFNITLPVGHLPGSFSFFLQRSDLLGRPIEDLKHLLTFWRIEPFSALLVGRSSKRGQHKIIG